MRPEALSAELRRGRGPYLARRRAVAGLSLVAIGAMGMIALYQLGLIEHLPDPPLPFFDADAVDASAEAYARLAMPDGALGLGSYAATLGLAAAGGAARATDQPWLPLPLAAKVGLDAAVAGKLTADQWTRHRAFCAWCLLASAATCASVPLVLPEARAAWRRLRGR